MLFLFYCVPVKCFYCVFLLHYFIANSICELCSCSGTVEIELCCRKSFRGEMDGGMFIGN